MQVRNLVISGDAARSSRFFKPLDTWNTAFGQPQFRNLTFYFDKEKRSTKWPRVKNTLRKLMAVTIVFSCGLSSTLISNLFYKTKRPKQQTKTDSMLLFFLTAASTAKIIASYDQWEPGFLSHEKQVRRAVARKN